MLGRAFLVALILVGGAFAGCISKDEPVEDNTPIQQSVDDTLDANESAAAPDGRGDISAFKETNKTEVGTGGMMHSHDYWKGQTRIDIAYIDSGLIPFPLMPEGKPVGTAIADYDIPKPHMVYEGTDHLELTLVKATDPVGVADHPHLTVMFDYLTAADEPGQFRTGGQLQPGTPFIIPVKPTEADMPHQTKSLWIFRIYSGEANSFNFNITVTAVKGNQIVNWPPHPNLYADKTERVIYDGDVVIENKGTADSNIYGTDGNWQNPERVISYGTDRVEVFVTNVKWESTVPVMPQPSAYYLEYHNASKPPLLGNGDQAGARLMDEGTDGQTYHFAIDLAGDTDALDTPYGEKSRWGFRFVPAFDSTGTTCPSGDPITDFLQQFLIGCQFVPSKTSYHIKIVAYGHSTVDGVKDAGLDGDDRPAEPTPPTA